jgi:hypothetical protein
VLAAPTFAFACAPFHVIAQLSGLPARKLAQEFAIAAREWRRLAAVAGEQAEILHFAELGGDGLVGVRAGSVCISVYGTQLLGQTPRTPPPAMPILVVSGAFRAPRRCTHAGAAAGKSALDVLVGKRAPWQDRHMVDQLHEVVPNPGHPIAPGMFFGQLLPALHRREARPPDKLGDVSRSFPPAEPVDGLDQSLTVAKIGKGLVTVAQIAVECVGNATDASSGERQSRADAAQRFARLVNAGMQMRASPAEALDCAFELGTRIVVESVTNQLSRSSVLLGSGHGHHPRKRPRSRSRRMVKGPGASSQPAQIVWYSHRADRVTRTSSAEVVNQGGLQAAEIACMTFDMGSIECSVVLYQHTQTEHDHDGIPSRLFPAQIAAGSRPAAPIVGISRATASRNGRPRDLPKL